MNRDIIEVLLAEKATLEELRALSARIIALGGPDTVVLAEILARRSELMLNLTTTEESRISFQQNGGKFDGDSRLPEEIRRLAHEVTKAEAEVLSRISRLLGDMKKEAANFERSLSLVQGYGMAQEHLSRFADRVG